MTQLWKSLACATALLLPFAGQASVALLGAAGYGLNSVESSNGVLTGKTKLSYGGGLLVAMGAFEVSALYLVRNFELAAEISGTSIPVSGNANTFHIPAIWRLGKGSTSFGLGGYFDVNPALSSSSDFGATAGIQFGGGGKGYFLDARFNYGIKSQTNPLDSTKSFRNMEILTVIGYRL